MSQATRVSVLFVCLGNICRSPLAKVVFAERARQRGVLDRLRIDSCGTGHWHAGGPADARSVSVARRNGLVLEHVARQIDPRRDFLEFDLIIAMDTENTDVLTMRGAPMERVHLVRSFDPEMAGKPDSEIGVPDPYVGGEEGFDEVYRMLDRACRGLLDHLFGKEAR